MPAEIEAKMLAPGRADQAHGRGRGVLLVVLVQDQQPVERLHEHRVDLVQLGEVAEVELEEVLDEAQRVVGVEERLAERLLVRVGGDDRQLREQPDGGQLDHLGVVRVERVLVVGRERRHGRRQHRHRVRGVRQRREEALEVLVQQRVAAHLLGELVELGRRRQLPVDEQPGDLEVGRVVGEVFDRVPAVAQDAGVAVDVGDRALGRGGVHEALDRGP